MQQKKSFHLADIGRLSRKKPIMKRWVQVPIKVTGRADGGPAVGWRRRGWGPHLPFSMAAMNIEAFD